MTPNIQTQELTPLEATEIELSIKSYEERLSKFILQELKKQGRTKIWLAEKIPVNYKSFANRLNKGSITITELLKTCEVLNLDIDIIYKEIISPNRKRKFIEAFKYKLNTDVESIRNLKTYIHELNNVSKKDIVPYMEGRIIIIDGVEYRTLFYYRYKNDEVEVYTFKITDKEYYKEKLKSLEDNNNIDDEEEKFDIENEKHILESEHEMLYNKKTNIDLFDASRAVDSALNAMLNDIGKEFN